MKKRLLNALFCLFVFGALITTMTIPASAETREVSYVDADGSMKTVSATRITAETNTLSGGWYYVEGNTTIPLSSSGCLIVQNDVNIILMDGCTLNVEGNYDKAGIEVPFAIRLSIYAQSEGENMGKLIATTKGRAAAIGGKSSELYFVAGHINIFGGHIIATSLGWGAAIGGGTRVMHKRSISPAA